MSSHVWSFSKIGGVKRVNLESGADLVNLHLLDQKLWTALSCPVEGLEFDRSTLELIDSDKDGQIRVPEILLAVKWILSLLKNPDDLLKQESSLPLSAINDENPEGKYLIKCAHIILSNLGKPDADSISTEDTSDTERIFASTPFNGDGVITEDSSSDPGLKDLIRVISKLIREVPDRSGKSGIGKEEIEQFYLACEEFVKWFETGINPENKCFPFGENTDIFYSVFKNVEEKIEDYFLRCRLISFDPELGGKLSGAGDGVSKLSTEILTGKISEIEEFPLSAISPDYKLDFNEGINPAWEERIQEFRNSIFKSMYKEGTHLLMKQWREICDLFLPYRNWTENRLGAEVESLGIDAVRSILSGSRKEELFHLLEKDKELEDEANSMIRVDMLVRYYRDLFRLLKNFVTFNDFYTPGRKAIFQAGILYIDQRSCELCIRVNQLERHESLVSLSGMYLLYCKCKSRVTNEEMLIVAALTNGDIDNLIVGRNAVFYDRTGMDWDATVVKIIENPISIRQAFWTPYRKFYRFIETQIRRIASSQEERVEARANAGIEQSVSEADISTLRELGKDPKERQPVTPFDIGKFVGIIAAIGLAVGAIGTAVASIVTGFLALPWWKMPLAIAGIVLIISIPSMIIAYLKLRRRNLAPLLDANGWAINARATVNIRFGNLLTQLASLPPNSKVNTKDPFTKKGIPAWLFWLILVIAALAGYYLFLEVPGWLAN